MEWDAKFNFLLILAVLEMKAILPLSIWKLEIYLCKSIDCRKYMLIFHIYRRLLGIRSWPNYLDLEILLLPNSEVNTTLQVISGVVTWIALQYPLSQSIAISITGPAEVTFGKADKVLTALENFTCYATDCTTTIAPNGTLVGEYLWVRYKPLIDNWISVILRGKKKKLIIESTQMPKAR